MRPLLQILKMGSPLTLAREAGWRVRKKWQKKRILAQIDLPCRFRFRAIPYYKPDISEISKIGRELLIAFADQLCEGRFAFLGYETADLSRQPRWNVDFVSGADWPQVPLENRNCMRFDGSDVK